MKYSELIQFEPIESVVQLRQAESAADARRLVETFVISDRMADLLCDLVIPQLQFNEPADTRGLLIVGNYGTGKSHLMAVISGVAEHADLAQCVNNERVAESAKQIAGRFKVVRAEIGSTTKGLRDIVCDTLEVHLAQLGVSFEFPSSGARHENKSAFLEMMAAFQMKFPKQGLILLVDELLDYLRSRKDQELSLDLSFLREMGEVCKGTRFRFAAGVQESLFDNPRFQFASDTLRRVKDRFEQVRISREDVAFVVSERLLKKDAKQKALVREHLLKFAPLFGSMNERMDEFVRLFPVHPAYLETFEQVYFAEKREALKTLSSTMRRMINQDVPNDDTGLIAYDSYWDVLRSNPGFRTSPEIRAVIDKSTVLESRIQQAFTRPNYKPAALRIIHGLSVHRLTTSDIYTPLGVTAEELRDDLCLMLPVPERESGFLRTVVETVLSEIVRTVSGQFLSFNKENGQYYIDLKKDVDFDSLIEKKAESLGPSQLDRYYFDALRRVVLEDPEAPPYVPGYRIWEYEIEWRERKAGRAGYLFFGAPNERSTAQPPRDFYVYFLQPYDLPYFKDEKKPDEVFLRLNKTDQVFERALKLYAGAREQATAASGSNKKTYEDKASEHLRTLTTWLTEHIATSVEVTYQGRAKSLLDVVHGKLPSNATVRDYVNTAGSVLLASHFADRSPDYPIFSITITGQNRGQAAQDALRWVAGSVKTKQGAAVLDALELLDGDVLRPQKSRYARYVIDLLAHKAPGQVLNRSELVQTEDGVEYWTRFRLEPEFLAVVVAAMVHSGDVVMSIAGKKLDATNVESFAKLSIQDVIEFKHVERPKDLPQPALQELCDLLGVPRGLIVNLASREEAVAQIQQRTAERLEKTVTAQARLGEMTFWSKPVLSDNEMKEWQARLTDLKKFLESLQAFNTVGKLKNFPHETKTVAAQKSGLELVREVESLLTLIQHVAPLTAYLGKAEAVLDAGNTWQEDVRNKRADLLTKIGSPKHRADASFQRLLGQTLAELKAKYQDAYLTAHKQARLGANDDKRKATLTKDARLTQLQKIAGIEMMPSHQLRDCENRLSALKTCFATSKAELEADPICPQCAFRPSEEPTLPVSPSKTLEDLDDDLDALVKSWTQTLLANLDDPTIAGNVDLLSDPKGKREVQEFIKLKQLPDPITPSFVKGLQETFSGLERVVVTAADFRAALTQGGLPCTLQELKERFERQLATITKGKDPQKVRVILE